MPVTLTDKKVSSVTLSDKPVNTVTPTDKQVSAIVTLTDIKVPPKA